MQISARNQIHVTITEIEEGAVKELGLTKGEKAIAIIKASEVMIAK